MSVSCPICYSHLDTEEDSARCPGCARQFERVAGLWDFRLKEDAATSGLAPRLMHWRPLARIYDRFWRPAFVAVATRRKPNFAREAALVEGYLLDAKVTGTDRSIIDLSCGPARMGRHLKRSGKFGQVYAVDRSRPMLEQAAQADAEEAGAPMDLLLADVRHLPFANASLFGIHAGAALHLWPDLPACAAEIARVLRPGGRFVGTTFVHASRRGLQYGLEWAFEKGTRTRVFKMEELEVLMRDAGLVNVQTERWNGFVLICAERSGM